MRSEHSAFVRGMTNSHQDEGREDKRHASIGRLGRLLSGKHRPEHRAARRGLDAIATLRFTSVVFVTSVVKSFDSIAKG